MLALVALFEDQVETLGIGDVLHHAAAEPSSELVCVAIDAPLDQRDLAELCRPFREDPHLTLVVAVEMARKRGLGDLTAGRERLASWMRPLSALPSVQRTFPP